MNIVSSCSDFALVGILSVVKQILQLIQIVGPILLTVSLSINFIKLVNRPDDKKIPAKIRNSIIALFVVGIFDESESFSEISATFLVSMMLGWALYFIMYIHQMNKWMMGYVIIISYMCDSFAYLIGIKFGKHKLNSRISPKKTIEGSVGGWICGAIISFIWAMIFNYFGRSPMQIAITSLCLPIVSEIGDLAFSYIKRHYGVKDFSNLIPGHGGILDRLDSNIFCIILFGALLILFK